MAKKIDPERQQIVSQVLEYWYTADFLNQGALHTEETRRDRENYAYAMKYPRRFTSLYRHESPEEGGSLTGQIAALEELIEKKRRDGDEQGRPPAPCCHGRITVYLGSTARAFLTGKIAAGLGCEPPLNPSADNLAWASLQLNEDGMYIRGSFSISPILWAIGRIAERTEEMSMYEVLDPAAYQAAREALAPEENRALGAQKDLGAIAGRLFDELLRPIGADAPEAESEAQIHFCYTVYRNANERAKREAEDYYGLSMSFYAEDLAGFKRTIDSGKWLDNPMWSSLIDYICAPYDMARGIERDHTDLSVSALRSTEKGAKARQMFREILDVDRAPLGKWPSRNQPFLMQQAAINLALTSGETLFAVNGPPGTGKTALLREIVADHVVRRALVLASFDTPDEMFDEMELSVGSAKTRYYAFRQDIPDIKKYAIVVASSNNAAVENISKQLPLKEAVEKGLSGSGDPALAEVRRCFSVECAPCETITRKMFEKAGQPFEKVTLPDIYFSSWATDLLRDDCWGLISAPLGRRSNVVAFYNRILNRLYWDFYRDKNAVRERLGGYRNAKKAFLRRYDRVLRLRGELKEQVRRAEEAGLALAGSGDDAFVCLTDHLLDDLCCDDSLRRRQAQMSCPRISRRLDRERELLFRDALALTKEFILASDRCKSNFSLLGMAWETDTRENIFSHASPEDKAEALRKCMASLVQTLQLLVPVISTTFASAGRFFKYVSRPGALGTVIVDEAGQATPQSALRLFSKASRAIIVGDPSQIDPVVTDELAFLESTLDDKIGPVYSDRTLSVQKIADHLARWGGTQADALRADRLNWVGVPLYVHSRCIDPMFSISNRLSYGGAMLRITKDPPREITDTFCYPASQWINVRGKEEMPKNHFIRSQGERILALLETAFTVNAKKNDEEREAGPDLFIITPFHTAAEGMKQMIANSLNGTHPVLAAQREAVENWLLDDQNPHIGTVHTFQGREANEVILMLGCDEGSRQSANWVSRNIVNVAVSRARYRLYAVGDAAVWSTCDPVMEMKYDLDAYVFDHLAHLSGALPESESVPVLPSCEVFETAGDPETAPEEAGVEPGPVLASIRMYTPFFGEDLRDDLFRLFGIASAEEFRREFSPELRQLLLTAFHIYIAMKPLADKMTGLYDASFVGICFCKALELRLKENYLRGFRLLVPDALIGGRRITSVDESRLTIGVYSEVAAAKAGELGERMEALGNADLDRAWWDSFQMRVRKCRDNRNICCHPGKSYSWERLEGLVRVMFFGSDGALRGLMFEDGFRRTVDAAFPEGCIPPSVLPEEAQADFVREYTLSPARIRTCPGDGEALAFEAVPVRRRDGTVKKLNMQRCARCGKYYISAPSLPQSIRLEEYDLVRQ